jgi:alginate O-acetyltransferase complex protein AlgI
MPFDSLHFLVFFPAVFVVYYVCARRLALQNGVLLAASFYFYGSWDWRFLSLMLVSSGIDYLAAVGLEATSDPRRRRLLLTLSLASNLVILGSFKYAGFFADSLVRLLPFLAAPGWRSTLDVVLPVGISFYTFQSMAYVIEVYRREMPAERNPFVYFMFVAFFPHLVAGPIQRAADLLPQFRRTRVLTAETAREALWLVTYGFFLKTVVANGAATFVDAAFRPGQDSGWSVILGTIAFGIQIYMDFNAYSLIARGTALFLGFRLVWNFRLPYASTSLSEFWRRWHISLSTWLRDYLYVPLGGNRRGRVRTYVNLLVTMTLGGLWHGAAWNFVAWGVLHGAGLAVERACVGNAVKRRRWLPGWPATMAVVFAGWFLFRVPSWTVASDMLAALGALAWTPAHTSTVGALLALVAPVALVEWWQLRRDDLLAPLTLPAWSFAALLAGLSLAAIGMFRELHYAFIYFQF